MTGPLPTPGRAPDLVSSLGLAAGSVLTVAFFAHHPSTDSSDLGSALAHIAGEAPQSRVVHGALIALMLVVFHGLVTFAGALGWQLARVRAATIGYALGVVCHTLAALTSGFVISGLAERHSGEAGAELEATGPFLALAHLANQSLAMTGVVAMSAGIFLWSCVLVGRPGLARVVGILGLLAGCAHALWILIGHLHLDVHGMGGVIVVQAVWSIGVAVWMLRARSRLA